MTIHPEPVSKRDHHVLEKIFEVEIRGGLPAQLRSKRLPDLERRGLVTQCERTFGGRFPVIVKGWELTELGRWTYCVGC